MHLPPSSVKLPLAKKLNSRKIYRVKIPSLFSFIFLSWVTGNNISYTIITSMEKACMKVLERSTELRFPPWFLLYPCLGSLTIDIISASSPLETIYLTLSSPVWKRKGKMSI